MSVNFLNEDCQSYTQEVRFGICDDDNKKPAYIATGPNEKEWIATVVNKQPKVITFTAIDNCIEILREDGNMESRCDVMMIYENNIIFVELKDKREDWRTLGINQIEITLTHFISNHTEYYKSFKKKRAYVANRKHQISKVANFELGKRIFSEYNIRLHLKSEIEII